MQEGGQTNIRLIDGEGFRFCQSCISVSWPFHVWVALYLISSCITVEGTIALTHSHSIMIVINVCREWEQGAFSIVGHCQWRVQVFSSVRLVSMVIGRYLGHNYWQVNTACVCVCLVWMFVCNCLTVSSVLMGSADTYSLTFLLSTHFLTMQSYKHMHLIMSLG